MLLNKCLFSHICYYDGVLHLCIYDIVSSILVFTSSWT